MSVVSRLFTGRILLGISGLIQPPFSALVHNLSTLAISLNSMKNLLEDGDQDIYGIL